MGMTIDEAHQILSNGLANAPSEHEWCMAFKLAIDIMRKYQKIEQIAREGKNETRCEEIVRIIDGKA